MEADERTPGDARRASGPRYLRHHDGQRPRVHICMALSTADGGAESPFTYAVPATGPTQPGTQLGGYFAPGTQGLDTIHDGLPVRLRLTADLHALGVPRLDREDGAEVYGQGGGGR
jgi:hypothetical protein